MTILDIDAVARRLDGLPGLGGVRPVSMPDTGLAHVHLRLEGTGLLLRVPKQSQMAFGAADNLAYQAACFRRAGPSGHVPVLAAVLEPGEGLPLGALVVEAISGRPPRLPDELSAIATALAAIHAVPVPPPEARPPLRDPADPVADTLAEVRAQARHLAAAGLAPAAMNAVAEELCWAESFAARTERPPVTLISFDAHPGNFLVEPAGRAVLVDLEKARYGAAGFDLAHATLYTSTTWDVATAAVLEPEQVAAAYAAWLDALPDALAAAQRQWLLPLRRIMWLWSVTWCAKWRVLAARPPRRDGADAEDWSASLSDPALVAHVAERVGHYLEPAVISRIRDDWLGRHALTELLAPQP
ncbi:phosphotransferase family protein [Arenibaculum pallidiluteum]|uniref:phosphotransferase family protein n=1 Tax=Arenibaculum pallidiluteum TaxID=2812559 RepID=UPI001A973300|nr:aminoglycoside phosphotransferase [Arenibaculum pallidiluteum]